MAKDNTLNAVGRRKTAVARIYMQEGTGKITVNKQNHDIFFPYFAFQNTLITPFNVTNTVNKYDIKARVNGGGMRGQAEAIRLAISKALVKLDPEHRSILKSNGFMKRDPRMKERKKSGQPGARKNFQFSKR